MAIGSFSQGNIEINKDECYVLVSVNPRVYPLDVVLSSAYIFTDHCYVLVDGDPVEELIVELRPKDKNNDLELLGMSFNNELINYANYAIQAVKNAKLREEIIKKVLSISGNDKPKNTDSGKAEHESKMSLDQRKENIEKPWEDYGEGKNKPGE